jgi:hypothetical protein
MSYLNIYRIIKQGKHSQAPHHFHKTGRDRTMLKSQLLAPCITIVSKINRESHIFKTNIKEYAVAY